MFSKLTGIVETITSFFEQLQESGYLTLDYIFYVALGLQLVLIVFFLIKSSYSYELRLDRSLDGLNRWLYYNQYLDETNLIDFNNRIKRAPKLLRYHWQQYMLYREKEPSFYMSTNNLIEKPLKTSSFSSNIKSLSAICYTLAGITLALNFASFTSLTTALTPASLGSILLNSLLTPLSIIIFNTFFTILLRSWQNSNLSGLYQNLHLYARYIDKSSVTLPEYIDFEVLFTKEEIKRGIPVLNEFLEKRARQEQKELEEAMKNTVDHEEYNFSHLGLNGSQILDRAMKETEIYLNQRQRALAEIRQLESEIESAKRNYENNQKEYERKMQASKENVERLRKQQEESTNRIESNYIRKQQTDEIKKQEQMEKDYEGVTLRYNQDINTISTEIATRKAEIEEKRQIVEKSMEAEYKTFSGKVFKDLQVEAEHRQQSEMERLLAEKDNYADLLQQANLQVVDKDAEIKRLNEIIESSNINRAEHGEFYNEELTKEHSQRKRKAKSQALDTKITLDTKQETNPLTQIELAPKTEPLTELITKPIEEKPQYDEFGGYYDIDGNYRYQNGTYYDPQGNFHDEFGGYYDKDGTYFPPQSQETKTSQLKETSETQPTYDVFGGYYDEQGFYRYQNGSYYDPQGIFYDEFGGHFDKDGNYFPAEIKQQEQLETKIVETVEEPNKKEIKKEKIKKEEPKQEEPKQEETQPAPRKRGRPRKVQTEEVKTEEVKAEKTKTETKQGEEAPAPKKRGRPRKVQTEESETTKAEPKSKTTAKTSTTKKITSDDEDTTQKPRAKRGRPLKKRTTTEPSTAIQKTTSKQGNAKKEESIDPLQEIAQKIQLENENLKQQHEELRRQIDSTLNEIDTLPGEDDKKSSNN